MKSSYLNLCTEFYDLTKPEADPKEVAFYEKLLGTAKGPILEVMCGSGRLLIPLLRGGLVVEGVDNSSHMLQSCQKRCSDQGLAVQLYHQSLQQLDLPRKYDLIFIAIGSFQLIQDRKEALNILKNFRLSLGAKRLPLWWMAAQSNFSMMHDASIPFSYLADRSHITSKIKYSTLAQMAKNQNSGCAIRRMSVKISACKDM